MAARSTAPRTNLPDTIKRTNHGWRRINSRNLSGVCFLPEASVAEQPVDLFYLL